MKNGCKNFISPTMDELKIEPYYKNRIDDVIFAQVKLRALNRRGTYLEHSIRLIQELYEYIIYLYFHINQLEKDKQYLLKQKLKYYYKK